MENVQDINITAPDKPPKNKGGRPYKYTVKEVEELVDKYIAEQTKKEKPISQAGFALYSHVDEDTVTNWKDKEGYSEQVKKLTLASKVFTIDMLFTMKNPAGAIFYGKNFHDMADKVETNTINTNIMLIANPDDAAQLLSGIAGYFQATEKNVTPALSSAVVVDSAVVNARSDGENTET